MLWMQVTLTDATQIMHINTEQKSAAIMAVLYNSSLSYLLCYLR